jgi:hypothetical protein
MLQQTILDTQEITTSTRTTGPLAHDPCMMLVQTGLDPFGASHIEPIRVPGVTLDGYSPRFAQGYAWGRETYYADVDDAVNADGTPHRGTFTQHDLDTGAVRIEQVKDIRPGAIVQLIRDVIEDERGDYEDVSFMERVGCIVGYIATCVERSYGMACTQCGRGPGLCSCSTTPVQVIVEPFPVPCSLVTTETPTHVLEVSEGCLTIDSKAFPDDCVCLSQEDTEKMLELLLIARYGLHPDEPQAPASQEEARA